MEFEKCAKTVGFLFLLSRSHYVIDQLTIPESFLSLQPPAVEDEEDLKSRKERAQVRLQIWLGLAKYQSEWRKDTPGGEVAVYAETVCETNTVKHICHTLIVE